MKTAVLILLAALTALCSCTRISGVRYAEFVDIPSGGIPSGWVYDFNPADADSTLCTSGPLDVILVLRYARDCASRQVILDIEQTSLAQARPDSARVTVSLFGNDGKPLGNGTYGIYEIQDTVARNVSVTDGYQISLSSPLPSSSTAGIKSVGIVLANDTIPLLKRYKIW